ncbi:MAG: DUF1328 domain-containing protein [Polyangiaceae bacterium]
MVSYAAVFLIGAAGAAVLGFWWMELGIAGISKVVFAACLIFSGISLLMGRRTIGRVE